jgi:hypothetical protein
MLPKGGRWWCVAPQEKILGKYQKGTRVKFDPISIFENFQIQLRWRETVWQALAINIISMSEFSL